MSNQLKVGILALVLALVAAVGTHQYMSSYAHPRLEEPWHSDLQADCSTFKVEQNKCDCLEFSLATKVRDENLNLNFIDKKMLIQLIQECGILPKN